MDNQQERLQLEIGYLLGVIDGEGHYGLRPEYNKQKKKFHYPELVIANTNPAIIDRCSLILKELGVPHYVYTPPSAHKDGNVPVERLLIKGLKRFQKLIEAIGEYDHAKKPQLDAIKEFVKYRFSIPTSELYSKNTTATQVDLDYKNKVSELNRHYNSDRKILRDYTLGIRSSQSVKI